MYVWWVVFPFVLSEANRTPDGRFIDDEDAPLALLKKVDVYPEHFEHPVPFGHIFREGFGDPFSEAKQPFDGLELRMRTPKNHEEAREMLKNGRRYISFINEDVAKKYSPGAKEEYLREMMQHPLPEAKNISLKWYDLTSIHSRNAMRPPSSQFIARKKDKPLGHAGPPSPAQLTPKTAFFAGSTFELRQNKEDIVVNWTTCDEFAVDAVFDPKDIINLKWTPFYIWSTREYAYAIEHTFEYPPKKVVSEYHMKYGKYLNKTVDWNAPKLLMQGMNEMLLIAADKRGLFDAIAKHEIPEAALDTPITLPSLSLRMKIEDPYLVLTFCEDYYATVMAVSGQGPTIYRDMKNEAATIKFQGSGRVVWRDYDGEKERAKLELDAKLQAEKDKIIIIHEPIPPVGQWEGE